MRSNRAELMKVALGALLICGACLLTFPVGAQTRADADLVVEISKIKAIDNHAHPLKYVAEGEKPDDEYDALPLEAIEAFPLPVRLNPGNPEFIRAWHDQTYRQRKRRNGIQRQRIEF